MKKYNYITKKLLIREYILNKKSTIQIAKEFKCSQCCIYKKMKKYKISIRKPYAHFIGIKRPYQSIRLKIYNPFKGKHHTEKTKKILSMKRKGKHNSPETEFKKGNKLSKKIKKLMSLIRGGTGIPYECHDYPEVFFKLRPDILKRDNYTCTVCCKFGNVVHHIDYDKQNCKKNNLITTCRNCNVKVNSNRDYWYAYFNYIMENIR